MWFRNELSSLAEVSLHSECVFVASFNQHAMRMRRAILSSVVCPAISYFSTLSHKRHDFRRKVTEHKMCVLVSPTTCAWDISHSTNDWTRFYHNVHRSLCKVATRYSCHIWMKVEFSRQIFDKYSNIKFNANISVGTRFVSCGRTDGQTQRS